MQTRVEWQGLPIPAIIVFFIVFLIWWILMLTWAAYKLNLLPDSLNPQHITVETVEVDCLDSKVLNCSVTTKAILFGIYCVAVLAGFILTLLDKIPFSMFILGVLAIAQILLTLIFFVPTIWKRLDPFKQSPVKILCANVSISKYICLIIGMIIYVLTSCGIIAVAMVFFKKFGVSDKSMAPWTSREFNRKCILRDFYDAHDCWHLFASFGLMLVTMLCVQISKPCRDCYLRYCSTTTSRVNQMIESLHISREVHIDNILVNATSHAGGDITGTQ